ncbi:hypothetical protein GIB67_007035 [Kingdonia uniflora]|uniref:Uncharacterized protein n=1 Tax=Kingdonia uniflora TaxID=39325 RepID=A0A7J7NZW9_9MAGN|nr:hypothetical protein GIB67_007035 [Kingdonia uniflora]
MTSGVLERVEIDASSHWPESSVLREGSSTGMTMGDEPLVHVPNDEDTDGGGTFGSMDKEILVAESITTCKPKRNMDKLKWLTKNMVLLKANAMITYVLPIVEGVHSTAKHWEGARMKEMYSLCKRAIGFYVWLRFQFVRLGKSSPRWRIVGLPIALVVRMRFDSDTAVVNFDIVAVGSDTVVVGSDTVVVGSVVGFDGSFECSISLGRLRGQSYLLTGLLISREDGLCTIEVPEVENLSVFHETIELMFEEDIMKKILKMEVSHSSDVVEVHNILIEAELLQQQNAKKVQLIAQTEHPWLQIAKKTSNVPLGDIVRSRLKQFSAMNRFKKNPMRVIAEHLSAEGVEVTRDMFKLMDTDRMEK